SGNGPAPHPPGRPGRQAGRLLQPLLTAIRGASGSTPVLVKLAPDLDDEQVAGIAALAARIELAGVIATNTTISREGLMSTADAVGHAGAGGLSGRPVAARSLEVLRILRAALPASLEVISVGGVETAEDVRERLAAGAALVQGYTGFVYSGPGWAREINRGLLAR